jgi:uncharacterized protein YggE
VKKKKENAMKSVTAIAMGVLGVLVVGFVALQGGHLAGQGAKEEATKQKEPRKISTSGSATIRVKPNRARLFLTVETNSATVKDARNGNKKDVEKVISALAGLKIADLKMKTTNVHMDPIYAKEKDQTKLPEILGYRVTTTFTVLISNDDPQKLAGTATQLLDSALENGANALQQITFFRDDLTETKRQALTKATADAVANAKALAAGDERKVLDVINIDGQPEYHVPMQTNNTYQPQDAAGTGVSLVAGEVEVTCRVSVTATFSAAK